MYYSGYFRSTDTTIDKEGQLYKVVIITNFNDNDFEYGGDLLFSESPFAVSYESEDGNIYKPYKCSTATVGLLQRSFNFEFNDCTGNNVLVMLLKSNNVLLEEDVKVWDADYNKQLQIDAAVYDIEWIGFATPNSYSQDFENYFDTFELECQDALSTLQYQNYTVGDTKRIKSFFDIIGKYIGLTRCYKHLYISDNLKLPADGDIFKLCQLDERNFFDEDNKPKKALEVMEQICLFLNVVIIPYKDSVYIIDYSAIKNGNNNYYHYSFPQVGAYYSFLDKGSSLRFTFTYDSKVALEDYMNIKAEDFSSTGTSINLQSIYNKFTVKDSLYSYDSIIADLEDKERWGDSVFKDVCGKVDDNNTIVSAGLTRFEPQFGVVQDDNNIEELTIIQNTTDSENTQKVFLRLISLKESESILDDSTINVYAYNKETKDGVKYVFGEQVESRGTYEFLRNHTCAQIIAYQTEDNSSIYSNPLKLDLKPAILISTPSEMTKTDYDSKNYIGALPKMVEVKSKTLTVGSGDYFEITGNFKYYRGQDCLPIKEPSFDDVCLSAYIPYSVSFNGKYYNGVWSPEEVINKGTFKVEANTQSYGTDFKFHCQMSYKDLLPLDGGLVVPAIGATKENEVNVGQLVFTIYRPVSPSYKNPAKATLITDLDIKVVTKSDVNFYNSSDDDTDTEYSNEVDNGSVEEQSSIDLDITTWDNKQPNFSSVIYLSGTGYKRLKHIYNRATGNILRAEEHIILNNLQQYSTQTVALNLNLHKLPLPYSTFKYHHFGDRLFIVDSSELDFRNNSYNLTIVEKK